jgi:hypothetical protein
MASFGLGPEMIRLVVPDVGLAVASAKRTDMRVPFLVLG